MNTVAKVPQLVTDIIGGKILRRNVSEVVNRHGINLTQFLILTDIKNNEYTTVTNIARELDSNVPLITMSSRNLIQDGIITANRDKRDRRIKTLSMTQRGTELLINIGNDLEEL